jgi:AraC-like DNA-binding protein
MKENPGRLPILDVNPDSDAATRLYPIQPYRMDEGVYVRFPSRPYRDIVAFYHQIRITDYDNGDIYPSGNTAVVCRLDHDRPKSFLVGTPTFSRNAEYVVSKGDYFVALFWLGMGYCLFPNPPTEIVDRHIPLDEIYPDVSPRFTEEMALAKTFHRRVYLFERFLSEIIIDSRRIPTQHSRLINAIYRGAQSSLDYDAKETLRADFSARHVRRLCVKYLGVSPNLLSRIIRYQKTLHLINAHPEDCIAGLAAEQGYFDQSHFIKEFRRFHSITPAEFIRNFGKQQEYHRI